MNYYASTTKAAQAALSASHKQMALDWLSASTDKTPLKDTLKSVRYQCECTFFFWLVAAWVKSRAERPSVSGVNRQLHVQIGCKLGIRNRKDELTKQAKRNKLQIKPEGN